MKMWLLLVAAGTGYLARCWQKSCKFKTGSRIFRHNAALHVSQGSPSFTPRRGRPRTRGRHGLRKRSQSARGPSKKLLQGRKEGRLVTAHVKDCNENLDSPCKAFDSLNGEGIKEQSALNGGSLAQGQTGSFLSCLPGKQHVELFLSSTTVCAQDDLGQASCLEKPLLSSAEVYVKDQDHALFCNCVSPVEKLTVGSSNGGVENQLEGVTSSSRNCLNHENPTEDALGVSDSKSQPEHSVPACPEFLRVNTVREERIRSLPSKLKESTEQAFCWLAKMARGFGHSTCSKFLHGIGRRPTSKSGFLPHKRGTPVFNCLSYSNPCRNILLEETRTPGFFPCTQHLKALLDREFSHQFQRCSYLPFCSSIYDLGKAKTHAIDFTGIRPAHLDRKSSNWNHSLESASECGKLANPFVTSISGLPCSREDHLMDEVSFVALGLAMGVVLVATGCTNELEGLHKLLEKNNSMIEELKKQIDLRFELDLSILPEVEKAPSIPTVADGIYLLKAPPHPDIDSCQSAAEKNSLELFNASNDCEASEFLERHANRFDVLEAELEAELELMELNGCNVDLVDCEWRQMQLNEGSQSEGHENRYVDKFGGDDTGYVDVDIHDPVVIQDVGQLYESDFFVSPLELERRLWQVLEQRHEERVCELENDLQVMQERLTAKEKEIQWWKDRVWWLMETSLGGGSESLDPSNDKILQAVGCLSSD